MFGRDRSLTSLLNDTFIRGILFQALIAIGLLLSINWLADNTLSNLANQGKTLGFDFLTRTAGFQISPTLGTWMLDYKVGKSTYTDVYLIGIINTFIVALLGILAATVIGFTVGIMRLSDNLVFRWFSSFYVEVVRNVPLLLQLFFWYFAVLRAMPSKREKLEYHRPLLACSNRQ
jgi:general L-amino acid transport system permease protein